MSTYTTGYDEKYKCSDCNTIYLNDEQIDRRTWRCPKCNGDLYIAAPHLASGHTLKRIIVTELRKFDSVHIPHTNELYQVIAIDNLRDGRIRVAYKNYGQKFYDENDFITIVMGGYYSDRWE